MRVLLYSFLEYRNFLDQARQIFAENIMIVGCLSKKILYKASYTMTESRWDLALPDCSPIVFEYSLLDPAKLDICNS